MRFNWLSFLQSAHVEYVTSGPNVARGNVNIACPWCGSADTSHHLGISLNGAGYGCWRNKSHRGVHPARLVAALVHCSWDEARRIVGDDDAVILTGDRTFGDEIARMVSSGSSSEPIKPVSFPKEIKALRTDVGMQRLFIDHLIEERDYTLREAFDLCDLYDLRYSVTGPFKYRLTFPVYMREGLVNWTGRAIGNSVVRYRTLSTDPEKARDAGLPVAPLSIERTLWNYDELTKCRAHTLVVCEGPFDALRIDYFGRDHGVRATCLFGTGNLSEDQVLLLDAIAPRFERRLLVLDTDAALTVLDKFARLEYIGFGTASIPKGAQDPAELTPKEVRLLFA